MGKFTLACAVPFALAQSVSAEVTDCLPIENDLDRLACYDREAGRTPVIEETDTTESNWRISTETSAFDDTDLLPSYCQIWCPSVFHAAA